MDEYKIKLLKKVVLIFVATIGLITFLFFSQNTLVYVQKNPTLTDKASVRYKNSTESEWSKTGFGLKILHKDRYVFEIADGNKLSRQSKSLKAFKINRIDLSLSEQKQVYKIASDTKDCIYGDRQDILGTGTVYSYDCPIFTQIAVSNPNNLYTYLTEQDYGLKLTVPYQSGVVGIKEIEKAPDETPTEDIRTHMIYVNKTQGKDIIINGIKYVDGATKLSKHNDRVFIYNSDEGKLAIVSNIESAPRVSIYQLNPPANTYKLFTMDVNNWGLYMGWVKLVDIEQAEGATEGLIQKYDLTGDKPLLKMEAKTTSKEIINNYLGDFIVIGNDKIAATSVEDGLSVVIFDLVKGKIIKRDLLINAQKIVRDGNNYYVLSSDGKVFVYLPQQDLLQLVFDSDFLNVQSINMIEAGLVIKGKTNSGLDSTLLMDKHEPAKYPRFEGSLPYEYSVNNNPYFVIDYWKDEIYVTTPPSYMLEVPIQEIHKEVNSYLSKNGILLNQTSIIYR